MPSAPYYQDDYVTIYHGDCREILPDLLKVDLVLTDPPYGIKRFETGFGYTRFRGHGCEKNGISWDKEPTEDELQLVLLRGRHAIVWGANNFSLPPSEHFLVWDKQQTVDNFADAELAWTNLCVTKIYHFSIHRHNQTTKFHPTEKPVSLMKWCIGLAPDTRFVLDPFMGSGTTLRAAKDLCRKATGIEIQEHYCEIAAKRMAQEVLALA